MMLERSMNLARRVLFHRAPATLTQAVPQTPDGSHHGVMSFSQQGEDMLLRCLFQRKPVGFYVDVGAFHPYRYSNTYYFYQRGWRGINIDPNPDAIRAFRDSRPDDVNLELAISKRGGDLTYFQFDEPAVNGLVEALSADRDVRGPFRLVSQTTVKTATLCEVLTNHLPDGRAIDFLSVDAEGMDLDVLASNDWVRFRPTVVLAEDTESLTMMPASNSALVTFMEASGYAICGKLMHTVAFADLAQLSADGNELAV